MRSTTPRRLSSLVRWREWDGEIVAYNGHTGDTHHFVDIGAWAFRHLADAAETAASLAAAAGREIDLPAGSDPDAAIARTLALFERLDLLAAP